VSRQKKGPGLGYGRRTPRPPLPEHLRLRRRMLALSSPVVLVLLLAGSLLLGVTFGNLHARAAYDDGRYVTAADRYGYQQTLTPKVIEPWKAWFNGGTADFQAQEHFRAVEDLREAHRLVPLGTTDRDGNPDPTTPECRVRTNLSLALEGMGDDAQEAGDPAMAVVHYNEAMDMIGPCTSDGESESDEQPQEQNEDPSQEPSQDPSQNPSENPSQDPSEQPSDSPSQDPSQNPGENPSQNPGENPSQQPGDDQSQQPGDDQSQQPNQDPSRQQGGGTPDETEQRQRQKADQSQQDAQGGQSGDPNEQPGGPGQDDPSGGEGSGEQDAPSGGGEATQEPTDPKQRELEERNREAERDRQEQEQQEGGGFGGGQNW
jgi:hypothetical protein